MFFGEDPKNTGNENKNRETGLHQTKKTQPFCSAKERNPQSEETTYRTEFANYYF
jgi:hypothetical protein